MPDLTREWTSPTLKTKVGRSRNVNQKKWLPKDGLTKLDMVFGGDMKELLPPYDSIPKEFKDWNNEPWGQLVTDWLYHGLKSFEATPKEGVDKRKALTHVGAILASFDLKHEHKMAGAAYLLSQWFDEPQWAKGDPKANA